MSPCTVYITYIHSKWPFPRIKCLWACPWLISNVVILTLAVQGKWSQQTPVPKEQKQFCFTTVTLSFLNQPANYLSYQVHLGKSQQAMAWRNSSTKTTCMRSVNICCYWRAGEPDSSVKILYSGIIFTSQNHVFVSHTVRRKHGVWDQNLVLYFGFSQFLILFSNLKINLHNFLLQWLSRINCTSERDRSSFDINGRQEDNGGDCKFLISSYDISTRSIQWSETLRWPKSTSFHFLSPWRSTNLHI